VKAPAEGAGGPKPLAAFFVSLGGSALLLGLLLLSDQRVFELKKARSHQHSLDRQITQIERENGELRAAIEAANRHELPAEKVAREELHLVAPGDLVLLYPQGSLSARARPKPEAGVSGKLPSATPAPSAPKGD
jgi:cell division protein FtsB